MDGSFTWILHRIFFLDCEEMYSFETNLLTNSWTIYIYAVSVLEDGHQSMINVGISMPMTFRFPLQDG
jgi:hypothetical protein